MNSFIEVFSSERWFDLVASLLHTLWIGVVSGIILATILRRISADRPGLRYGAALAALFGVVLFWLLTWAMLEFDPPATLSTAQREAVQSSQALSSTRELPSRVAAPISALDSAASNNTRAAWIATAAVAWLGGLTVMLIRLVVQLVDLRRIRRESAPVVSGEMVRILDELSSRLGIRHAVRLASNPKVSMPSVFGVIYPTILFPVSLVSGVPTEHLRAILAHELAHIRRHDYLVNFCQQMIEALLFFNPAIWWINRQIRIEREACCDLVGAAANGERGAYARALTDWVEQHRAEFAGPLQLAFGNERRSGSLLERVKRLLMPSYQPVVRLPWYSFVSVLVVSGLVLYSAWHGSRFAVSVAAQFLTPEQRIEKIAEIRSTFPDRSQEYTAKDRITLVGRVRTADETSLPKTTQVHVTVIRPGAQFGIGPIKLNEGRFQKEVEFGKAYLIATAEGFAPSFAGPIEAEPGGNSSEVELVLDRGISSRIGVVRVDGTPIPNVPLSGRYEHPGGWLAIESVTDAGGIAKFENAAQAPIRWQVRAAGYQYAVFDHVILDPDKTIEWKLEPAKATIGVVVDASTGAPVSAAEIRLLRREGYWSETQGNFETAPLLTRSDSNGRFVLSSLNHQARHVLGVVASGFASRMVSGVVAGQEEIRIALGPPLHIRGLITGDLASLRKVDGKYVVDLSAPIVIGDHSHYSSQALPVDVRDGVGYFEATGLRPGEVRISAGNKIVELNLAESQEALRIDIERVLPPTKANREIVIRLIPPRGMPLPRGSVKVQSWTEQERSTEPKTLRVENGEVKFQVASPGWIGFSSASLTGYWCPEEHLIEVKPGEEPLLIERDVIPAGAIIGKVTEHDGSETDRVLVSVIEVQSSPHKKRPGGLHDLGKSSAGAGDGPTRFMVQPLPLGGKYMIVAHRERSYTVSPAIYLNEEEPIREIKLVLAKGTDLFGKVVDSTGASVSGVEVTLNYSTPYSHSFGSSDGVVTGPDGLFRFKGINADTPGYYTIEIKGQMGFRPVKQKVDFRALPARIVLRKGEVLTGVVLNDHTGNPLSGVEVYVALANPKPNEPASFLDADELTNTKGEFRFTTLEPRDYWVRTRSGSMRNSAGERIQIQTGKTGAIVLRIEPHKGARIGEEGRIE